jgi:cell division septation protein DedD
MAARGARRRGPGFAALLVAIGVLGIVGGTFGAGFFTGAYWPRVKVLLRLARPTSEPERPGEKSTPAADHSKRPPGARGERGDSVPAATAAKKNRGADESEASAPALTFYRDLTAPLSAPPRAATAPPAKPRPVATSVGKTDGGIATAPAEGQFAVQVAAYADRAQAEALRERLKKHGFAADVIEATTASGTRWRVRVGTYTSRDDARAAADHVTAESRLDAIVVRADGGR